MQSSSLELLWHTHSVLLAPITGMLPLRDELFCRMAKFVLQCIARNNSIVNFMAWHDVYFRRMRSEIGLNTQLCVKVAICHCTALAASTESWLGILSLGIWASIGLMRYHLWIAIGQEWFGCNFVFECCWHGHYYLLLVLSLIHIWRCRRRG